MVFGGALQDVCGLPSDVDVEDAFPCSPLQEGLIALAAKQDNAYMTKYFFQIPDRVNLNRFKAAWDRTVELCGNLRTRILSSATRPIQVLLKSDPAWEPSEGMDLEAYTKHIRATMKMGYGSQLNRYTIIEQAATGERYFVWVSHHAVLDGWSLQIVLSTLHQVYHETAPRSEIISYSGFIKHILDIDFDAAQNFWKEQLDGAHRPTFPDVSPDASEKSEFRVISHNIPIVATEASKGVTTASILRAARSLVLSGHTGSDDVSFGATVSGRNAPIAGIQQKAGPAIATVPVRVQLDRTQSVNEFLRAVQTQASDMTTYEQLGVQNIAKISPDARAACDFRNLMIIQPKQYTGEGNEDALLVGGADELKKMDEEMSEYFNYPLVLVAMIMEGQVTVRFFWDTTCLTELDVHALSHQLEHVVQQLLKNDATSLNNVSLVGAWEKEHALKHQNLRIPAPTCPHWEVEKNIQSQPEALAIEAWDGAFTYTQLGGYATRVAKQLQALGVGPEIIVPFCFPKSAWAVIAMLAIHKAGGAFAPLDPGAPLTRLQGLIQDTKATVVVAATSSHDVVQQLNVQHVIELDEAYITSLTNSDVPLESRVQPTDASFVIFTSGSTGKPKGILHEHTSLYSAAAGYAEKMNFNRDTRLFTYSAYTFDMGIMDVFAPLMNGGVLCIPSDHQRYNDIAGAIHSLNANSIFLTPTVAALIDPRQVPNLKDISVGGEPML